MPRPQRVLSILLAIAIVYVLHVIYSDGGDVTPQKTGQQNPFKQDSTRKTPSSPGRRPSFGLGNKPAAAANLDPVREPLTKHPLQTTNLDIDYPGVEVDERGMVTFDVATDKRHPIEVLMERAKLQVAEIDKRIEKIQSVKQAARDYERAWKMKPPRGFESWYNYARDQGSLRVPSLFPTTFKPFLTFLSYPAEVLHQRVLEESVREPMWTFTFVPEGQGDPGTGLDEEGEWYPQGPRDARGWRPRPRGRVQVGGPFAWKWRCNNTLNLIAPLLPLLPDEFFTMKPPLTMVFNADDGPRGIMHDFFRERSTNLAMAGRTWNTAAMEAAERQLRWTAGWHWGCPDGSPLRDSAVDTILNGEIGKSSIHSGPTKEFVGDFYMSTDVCYNPNIRELHSNALGDHRFAHNPPSPYVSVCRTLRSTDIVGVPLDAVYQTVPKIKWEAKAENRVLWRGSGTGISQKKDLPWRKSQRQRLHYFANNQSSSTAPVLVDHGPGKVTIEDFPVKLMNEKWFDIGLAGGPTQCSEEDGTCEELRTEFEWKQGVLPDEALAYKYTIDVDGNAWSSRFRRLLSSNNVVLKSTMFPEWFNDILVPWYHYVPIKFDYSDVYDIMGYFLGAPDGSSVSHDEAAKQIAAHAVDFVEDHWRPEDMRSIHMLVLLEYWRIMSPDRKKAVYNA